MAAATAHMSTTLQSGRVLSEDDVRRISRSIRAFIPSQAKDSDAATEEQLNDFRNLLRDVLFTCASPGLKPSHRVVAWNTLCSLIDQSLEASLSQVTSLIWDGKVWEQAFKLCLSHAQTARPKSSRQLHITLTNALLGHNSGFKEQLLTQSADELVVCLLNYEAPSAAKASAQLMGHLLGKDVLSLKHVLCSLSKYLTCEPPSDTEHMVSKLIEILLLWLVKGDFGSSIAQLLTIILDRADKDRPPTTPPFWIGPLQDVLQGDEIDVDTLRVHVLPVLFKRNFNDYVTCLEALGIHDIQNGKRSASNHDSLLFATLQAGIELGFVEVTEHLQISSLATTVLLPLRLVSRLVSSSSRKARLSGLMLLINSQSLTRPFKKPALTLIQKAFVVLFADIDADFRSSVCSSFQKLIDRLRSITASLARQARMSCEKTGTLGHETAFSEAQCTAVHRDFINSMIQFLRWELRPTASYQRHISALKCLLCLTKSGIDGFVPRSQQSKAAQGNTQWPFSVSIMSHSLQQLLLNLVLDPFDDVRQCASIILGMYRSVEQMDNGRLCDDLLALALSRAESAMLRSGRADQADGVAHLYALSSQEPPALTESNDATKSRMWLTLEQLLSKLDTMIQVAERNLADAVSKYPVHGLLTSIRYVMNQRSFIADQYLHKRMFGYLTRLWAVVKPVLCNDAPEGLAFEDFDEALDTTKETLSYCWRALKEASLLLGVLVAGYQDPKDNESIIQMCDLCFAQLAELRHRGAFSTVAQTWIACCQRSREISSADGSDLLKHWYNKVLSLVHTNLAINTRRSAGLPSLLTGVLVADQSGLLLQQAVRELDELARREIDPIAAEKGSLSQVHAMNCIKDILKHSRLGEQSERHIPSALQLAAHALQSDTWAVRNCGLMLFRAVIDRLLGTDQSFFEDDVATSKHISAQEYPELLDVILDILSTNRHPSGEADSRYEGVFPALQLLTHVPLPDERLQKTLDALLHLVRCSSWHVRDKAARTIAALIVSQQSTACIDCCLQLLRPSASTTSNELHGSLLATKYVFIATLRLSAVEASRQMPPHTLPISDIISSLLDGGKLAKIASSCFVTHAAYVDCLREVVNLAEVTMSLEERNMWRNRILDVLTPDISVATEQSGRSIAFQRILTLGQGHKEAGSLRQAAVRLFAKTIVSEDLTARGEGHRYTDLILDLAEADEDACKHLLSSLDLRGHHVDSSIFGPVKGVLVRILEGSFGTELKSEAHNVLSELMMLDSVHTLSVQTTSMTMSNDLYSPACNQHYVDSSLQTRALYLDRHIAASGTIVEEDKRHILSFIDDCVWAVDETGLNTREAAAHAMGHLQSIWTILDSQAEILVSYGSLCIAVYDLLQDDEEELRLLASAVTGRILTAGKIETASSLEPIVASQKLLGHIATKWTDSQELARTALHRAFGISESDPASVSEQLADFMQDDAALFAEEKQNLYVDEAREIRAWSQVLLGVSVSALPHALVKKLGTWVTDGLEALLERSQDRDGPLGWSSNADVFTLGLQVIYGAETLLQLAHRGGHIPVRPSQLRRQLVTCQQAFRVSEINDLWIWTIERLLGDAVSQNIGAVAALLANVHSAIPKSE